VNFSDSALLVGAAQRLYRGGIGSFSLGGITIDRSNTGLDTQLFLHQAFLDYQTRTTEAYVGRTDQPPAQLVTFPTLRGDDLVTFTNLLDPFSGGDNAEEHRYANVAAVTLNRGLRYFGNFHAQHLISSAGDLGAPDDTGLNSYGVTFQYLNLPGLEAIQRVVSYGAGYEHRTVADAQGGSSEALYAGGVFNLKPSRTNRIDLRLLDIYTFGNDVREFRGVADTFRADANQITAAVRYLHSPFGNPGSQLSLTAGYKSYRRVSDANSFGLALTGVKRLGQGFDAVAQALYQRRDPALAAAYGGAREDRALQIGLVFSFNATFNQNIGPRRTLLNLNHQYIPN
jgi:hypothetical protein